MSIESITPTDQDPQIPVSALTGMPNFRTIYKSERLFQHTTAYFVR